jgi:hypothetical protein
VQAGATSLIQSNQATGQVPGQAGGAGAATPGTGGTPGGALGFFRNGTAGRPGVAGMGIGGGLYLSSAGGATLDDTTVASNRASTSDPDIAGTFSQ